MITWYMCSSIVRCAPSDVFTCLWIIVGQCLFEMSLVFVS